MSGRNLTSSLLFSRMSLHSIVESRFNVSKALAEAAVQLEPEDASAAEPETSSCSQLMDASNAIYLYAFPLLLMLGILFNGVNFVLFRSSIGLRLYSSFTIFICTVSVTDSLALVAQAPRRWLSLLYEALNWHSLLQPNTSYDTSDIACKALSYVAELMQFVSLWTVVLLAWERSIVAQNPYRQSRFRQTRTACHAVAFVVISGLVLKSHVILSWQTMTTQPLVALTTGNATTSSLTGVTTSKQYAGAATTKRPTRNLAPAGRCSSYNRENRMKKGECVKETVEKATDKQGLQQKDRAYDHQKWQKEAISHTQNQDLHSQTDFRVNNQTDTTAVIPRLSSAYNHQEHQETNNGSKTTALDQIHRNDTFPNYPRDFSPSENRETSAVTHQTVSNTIFDPRDMMTSSTAAIDGPDKMDISHQSRQVTVSVEVDMTRHQLMTNGTGQNETDTDIGTDAEPSRWNPLQQVEATPLFLEGGNAAQGFPDSPFPMGHENLADSLDNVSSTDVSSVISSQRRDTVDNGSSPTHLLLGNLSSYSANDQTSLEDKAQQQHLGSKEPMFQHKRILNGTSRRRRRLKKRDIVSETQPKAKPCSRFASGQCQFIQSNNATQTTTAIWMVSLTVEALTKVLPAVLLSALLVSSLTGLHSWNIDQTRLTTDLTCRLLMERHVTVMAVCIITSQVILCLPMSIVWLLDVYFRLVTGLSTCQEVQMVAASVLTELVFMVNFAVKFLLCFLSGRQILSI